MIVVASRRKKTLPEQYPGATIVDVTSRGVHPWVRFSPFFPHGGIPVPFSEGVTSMSVEGIWQGLKVFERADVDPSKFAVADMKGLKRSVRTHGRVLGHRRGVHGDDLLAYREARYAIYLPSYRFVLEHHLRAELELVRDAGDVVLVDYETNEDIENLSRPLSHASLIRRYLANDWPS